MTIRQWHLTRGHHADGGAGPAEPAAESSTGGFSTRRLGVIGLALVLIAAMDSIRNLPTTAIFGWSAIFFYGIAVIIYLVPVALCSAELATTVGGGMYRWVREAFGSRWGFLAVWCDWSENIVWFPTVLVFLATTLAYVINPNLSQNKAFLVPVMLVIFWAVTLSSLFGSLKQARWTGVAVVIGTAIPTVAIIALGLWWVGSGNPSEIPFHASAIVPGWHGLTSLVYAAGIIVAFAGMEIGGFYSHVTRNVKRTYPRSVLMAAATVASLSILGSVAIAKPEAPRPFKIPGGKLGLAVIVGLGVAGAAFVFFLGFIPATSLSVSGTIAYVAVMAVGMIAIIGTPFLLHRGPSITVDTRPDPNLLASSALGKA
jgi:glutamate:GABA antiporter